MTAPATATALEEIEDNFRQPSYRGGKYSHNFAFQLQRSRPGKLKRKGVATVSKPAEPFSEVVVDYESLIAACRIRCDHLQTSRLTIDAIAGWAPGLASKLLSATPLKHRRADGKRTAGRRLGLETLGPMLAALGMKLIAVEDSETLARYRGKRTPRAENQVRTWLAWGDPVC